MPIGPFIAAVAGEFAQNTSYLEKVTADLTPEQWLARPNSRINHIAWIAGHVLWARQALIGGLGGSWTFPQAELFARSAKLDPAKTYPAPKALIALWHESATVLQSTLEALTPEQLDAPAPPGPPTPDGKTSGFISVLAWHETLHLGQISYLRSWLGQPGIFG